MTWTAFANLAMLSLTPLGIFWGHPVVEMRKDKIISIVIIKQGADDKGEDK